MELSVVIEPTGADVVRLHIDTPSERPVWPQDSITDDWLAGIAEVRARANARTDAWDIPDTME